MQTGLATDHHVVVVADGELGPRQYRPRGLQLHHHDLAAPGPGLERVQLVEEVGVPHVGDAGVVDQRDQGVQRPRRDPRDPELEAVCEEDADDPPGERLGHPGRGARQQRRHPVRGGAHLLVEVALLDHVLLSDCVSAAW